MLITAFTNTRQISLTWATSIQSPPPHPTSWQIHLNIILPSTPCIFHARPSPPLAPPPQNKTLYTPRLSPIRTTWPCPSHFSLFYQPNNIGWVSKKKTLLPRLRTAPYLKRLLQMAVRGVPSIAAYRAKRTPTLTVKVVLNWVFHVSKSINSPNSALSFDCNFISTLDEVGIGEK